MRVIVIGAGVVGAAIAESLAIRGAEVTILEMRAPGRGASQASAGMLAPYTEAASHPELLTLGVRSLELFDGAIARLRERAKSPPEYVRSGSLEVAFDEHGIARLDELATVLRSARVRVESWSGEDIERREPALSRATRGGLFIGAHGFVGVEDFVAAYLDSARWAGAALVSPVEVTKIAHSTTSVEVFTRDTRYEGDVVVCAGGSWASRVKVTNVPSLPLKPIRGQLLHLKMPPVDLPQRVVWGPKCYVVPWSSGSLLVGATVEDVGFDERTTVAGIESLMRAVTELVPAASRAELESVRVGLRPALPDEVPAIGPFAQAPRVIAALGHFRNGVLLAPLTADLVSRLLLDGDKDPALEALSPDRQWGAS